jgi:chromate reductase
MAQLKIAVFVGSLRRQSFNRELANALVTLGPADFTFAPSDIGDLPLYNQDDDDHQVPQVLRLKQEITSAQGILFVTPEYNRSIPGVLKNAIDHASRPYGQSAWKKKPAGVIGISPGPMGTALSQQHLRNVLAAINVPVLCLPEAFVHRKDGMFDANGKLVDATTRTFLQKWMDAFAAWIRAHQS